MRKKFLLMIFVLSLFTSMGGGWLHAQTKNGVSSTNAETITFEDDFTSLNEEFWTRINADENENNWYLESGKVVSLSYSSKLGGELTPDNYIVTKNKYQITESSVLTIESGPYSNYIDDTYSVVISEDNEVWISVFSENFSNQEPAQEIIEEEIINLGEYSGKNVHIGVRHYYGHPAWGNGVVIDKIKLTGAAPAAEPVAKIGETPYTSFADAVTAATAGQTITLIADVEFTEMVTIPEGKVLALDLNGQAITVPEATERHIYALNNKGVLTIKDSKGNGSISARGIYNGWDGNNSDNTVAGAKLIVEGGNFYGLDANGGAAIFNCAEATINGGVFDGQVAALNGRRYANTTINGGTFRSVSNYAIQQNNGGEMTINNATVDRGFGAVGVFGGKVTIVDGTFMPTGKAANTCHVVYVAGGTVVDIQGGTFKMNYPAGETPDSGSAVASYYKGNLTISGGSFTAHFDNVSPVELSAGSEITGGKYLTHSGAASKHTYVTNFVKDGYKLGEDGTVAEVVPAAKIGETPYNSFADALNAAKSMTGDVTVEIYEKVTMNQALAGSYNSINFVGKDTDAEIYLDVQGYTTATGKKVAFNDLKLSKSEGGFIANAGFMNVAFGIFDVAEVSYTNCTFLNGAYASSGKVTFNGCTFYRSHDKYGLWAYGNVDITVDGSTFADYRGIKMYAENGANASVKKPKLVVNNTNFSAVNNKPAIVLTYGESVVLEGNTYSSTGVFELDLDGKPNGVAVTSDVAPTCINDNGACGVLVDGKIYTTVAQAAEVATSTSTVTLLHNSTETVEFPMGTTIDKNGFTADNVTTTQPFADYVVLPSSMNENNYKTLFGTNTVTDGTNYYATLQAATEAVAGTANAVLYCKPNANVGSLQHAPVTSTLTVYGNNANVINGGERDFDLGNTDPNGGRDITADMTLTVKRLNGCGAWGAKATAHTVNLVFENCYNMGKVFISGTTGTLNITMTDCAFDGVLPEAIYSNADGAISLNNVAFSNLNKAVNLNHKAAGTQTVTINGCSFTNCGNDVAKDEIPVRVLTSVAGGNTVLAVSNTTFSGTIAGGADILLPNDKGITDARIQTTAANVKEGTAEMKNITASDVYEYSNAVAQIGTTKYASLQAALNDAAAGTGNVTVEILDNINLTGIDWNPVTVSAPAYPVVTVEGNNNTITGLNDMLFAATWAGNSGLIIKNLTIENSTIENDKNDAAGNVGVGAFVGYPQASAIITLENCHLKNSSVEGGHWTGGLIGMAGGYNGADGPVFMNLTIKGCSVTGSTITGKGSVGGVIGHGSCSAWTNVVIEETTVSGNAITSTGSSDNKAGAVMGTIGAAGQATTVNGVEKQGGALVAATVSGNTVKSNGTAITTIYGRQGTSTGVLKLNGGSYDNYPIEEGVAYAKPAEGFVIKENANGTFGVKSFEGEGTAEKPYMINDLEELIAFRNSVNSGAKTFSAPGVYVTLGANIDLEDEEWTPIGNITYDSKYVPVDASKVFSGIFDGNGKTISNLKVSSTVGGADEDANVGLFGITGAGAVIKNLTLTNVNINTDGRNVGAIAGFAYKATLSNIKVNGDIQIKGGNNVSGVAGMTRYYAMSATDISVKGNDGSAIVGNNIVGGIFAEIAPNGSEQNFDGLHVENIAITGVGGVGGIVGLLTQGTVKNVSVKNVVLTGKTEYKGNAMGRIRLGSVSGLMGGSYAIIADETIENVTAKNLDGNAVELPVIGANYDASSNATEAKIGDKYYATFAAAYKVAQANETITLLADITTSEIITINKNFVIDGNGKKLTTTATRGFQITGGTVAISNLTIDMPNAAEGNRGINLYNGDTNAALDVTLNNVTINGGKAYAVNIGGGKDNKLTINGSTLTGYAAINVHTSSVNHTIVVDRSTLNGKNHNKDYHFATVVVDGTNAHSLTITNTTINNENLEGITNKYDKVIVGPNCTLVWDGNAAVRNVMVNGLYYTDLQAAIKAAAPAGTVDILGDITVDEWIMFAKGLTTSDGSVITLEINGLTINGNGKTLTIKEVVSPEREDYLFYDATNLNINNLTISCVGSDPYDGGISLKKGTIENVTFNGGKYAVLPGANGVTVTGCTFNGTTGYAIYFEDEREGIVVTGNTFNTADGAYAITMRSNEQFTGNTVVKGKVNIANSSTATVTGNDFGTERFKVYNGASATIENNTINVLAFNDKTEVKSTFGTNELSTEAAALLEESKAYGKAAKIGENYYATLDAAIKAAKAGETVTILAGTYPVPAVKAGITIEGQGDVLFEGTLKGTLENLTMKNIHIKGGNAQRWAYAKGDLVFENVTFEATSVYALHFDGIAEGTKLTYKNCTIIGWAAMGGSPASCTFDGCTIKGNGTYGVIRTYFDATIQNCTFDVAKVNTNDIYEDGIHAVEGATVTVNGCTNVNGNMKDIVNVHTTSVVTVDDVVIKNVVKANDIYYRTLAEAFAANSNGIVTLLDNIDLAGAEWTPVNFNGVFDGQNYTISNLVVNGTGKSNQGFFGTTQNGEIKNVTFKNAEVTGRLNVGVVAGQPYTSKYTNVEVTGHVEVNGMAYVGGVGGKNAYANWTDITVDVDDTSYVKANSVENGTAYRTYVGGVVGFNGEGGHTFKNISSNIKVIGSTMDIGGIFGIAHYSNKFENITFTGSVEAPKGAEEVGGIAGVWHNEKGTSVTFTNCTSEEGTVTIGTETTTGSIVGAAYNPENETAENSGSLIIDGKESWLKVAQVGEVKYTTLQAAVNAVKDGDTITLIANEVFTKNNRYNNGGWWDGLGYSGDKSFTIDLAGKTIKQDGALNDYLIWIKNDGSKDNTINIINGTIDAGTTAYCALATASSNSNKITINTSDINFVGNNSNGAVLKIRGGAELNAKAGTIITGNNNYVGIEVVGTNTVVNINEGVEIYQNGTGSYVGSLAGVSNGATLNVIGGKGTSAQGGFIAMTSGGTINVSGGEWIANTNGTPSNDNKGVLIAQSEKGAKSIVNVKGGTFRGGYNCYGAAAGDAQINIKGGNFNANPTTYVVDKYEVVEEANGTFTVKMASFEKFYTATGVETTTGGVFSLAFEPTSETEVSVKIGSKNPAENKNYDLIIPSSVEFDGVTYAVTSIPEEGFKVCKGFDKLVVPGTITSVSASAFYNCSRLKEIKIEEGVQKLGANSFYKISDLETLTLPSTLTKIESLCFKSTEYIETIICNAQTPPTASDGCFTATVYKNALVYVAGEYEDYKAANGWKNFNNIIAVGATQTIVKTNYTLIATITDVWNRTCSIEIGTAPTNTKRAQLEIPEHVSFSGIEFDITSIPESGFQDCKYFEGTLTIPAYITSIGRNAFNGCSGITELVVEEGVTSLGTYGTFDGCRYIETIILPSTLETIPTRCFQNIHQKLNTIVCNAMTPPTLSSNFSDNAINDGLTLYVHDVDAYIAAARWNQIKSIRLIGAVAQNMTTSREYKSLQEAINEAAGATVKVLDNVVLEEAITVAAGAEVTLDLNGKVVSYESAVVGEDMITNNGKLTVESSVAGGKITYNNTDETGSNVTISTISTVAGSELIINGGIIENTSLANYSSRVLVPYAIDILTNGNLGDVNVTINGGEIVSTNYIAIRQFVNGNVCNNSLTVKGGTITGLKRAINVQDAQGNGQVKNCAKLLVEAGNIIAGEGGYAICNFANSENVALTGGNFVGTVYSAINGIISGGTFSEEPYSGYLADGFICEPNADGTYSVIEEPIFTQTIQLNAGWNWFSSYVETDLESLQAALETSGVQIEGKNGYVEYYGEYGWLGDDISLLPSQMYMIQTSSSVELELSGKLLEKVEITLNEGWNWISFPMNTSTSVNDALSKLSANNDDVIEGKSGYATYYEGYGWIGTLETLEPGQGYMYYSNNETSVTFTYSPSSSKSEAKANITTEGNYWTPNAALFANNMIMTAVLDVENINYEVAAFVNGECRGSARPIYVEPLDAYMLFLTIHGEEVEEMTFKYYDIDTDTEYTLSDRINYSNGAILGSLKEPYMFTRGTTGIGEAELSQLNIYPNPTTTAAEINLNATFDKVEVFNALGVKVAEYSNVDSIDALETAGIYVIRATNNSVISHCRLVVK